MRWFSNEADSKLERRVRDLEATVARLETDAKQLRLEWEKTFEQVMHALRRLGKRARDAEEVAATAPPQDPPLSPTVAAIMARREAKFQRRRGVQ